MIWQSYFPTDLLRENLLLRKCILKSNSLLFNLFMHLKMQTIMELYAFERHWKL